MPSPRDTSPSDDVISPRRLPADTIPSSVIPTTDPGSLSKIRSTEQQMPAIRFRSIFSTRRPSSYVVCFLIGLLYGSLKYELLQPKQTSVPSGGIVRASMTSDYSMDDIDVPLATDSSYVASSDSLEVLRRFSVPLPPLLLIVTPTYVRPFQAMYLHRLANTLSRVRKPVLWLVVEMTKQSAETAKLLRQSGLTYRHLAVNKNLSDIKDRGVQQRNAAMQHIEEHRLDGIVYFADDDNVYTDQLFVEIRKVKRFGVLPVGFLQVGKSKPIIEGPVCSGHAVTGWHTNVKSKALRRFHLDMCGFAFNSTILWDPARWDRPSSKPIRQLDTVKEGFQETTFIEQLVADESQMEGLADGCTRTLVFHLHLEGYRGTPFPHWITRQKLPVTAALLRHES